MWKVRGAAHPDTQMHLRQLLRQHKPGILLLTETGLGGVRAEELFREIPYSGLERVDPVGFSGGIWLFWNKGETTIDLIAKTDQVKNVVFQLLDSLPSYPPLACGKKG